MTTLADELRALGLDVADDDATLTSHGRDASVFEVRPQVVVFPRSADDVAAVVRYADAHPGLPVIPRSAGTDMGGGSIGAGISLDTTKHLHELAELVRETGPDSQDGYAVVQPGMYYRDLERATLARGLQFPAFPASRDLCAIGGIVANNAGGERSLRFGQTIDWVRSVRVVLSDGSQATFGPLTAAELTRKEAQQDFEGAVYRGMRALVDDNRALINRIRPKVSKNASGYALWRVRDDARGMFDLSKLLVGSQGTLAVITQATLGLVKPEPHRAMCVTFMDGPAELARVVAALLPLKPEAIESFDDKTLSFTLRFLPDFVRLIGASSLISLGLKFLPEAWMALRGGLPKLIVIAEFASDDEGDAKRQAAAAVVAMRALGLTSRVTKGTEESHKYWTIRRQSFNVIRSHAKGKRTTPFIDDFIVPPATMPEFLPRLYALLEPYRLTLTVAGHVGNGNFHIIPLMDMADERNHRVITELSPKVYDLVLEYGGSITAEHNDGIIRGPWVAQQFGADGYELFRKVKATWDPKGILNPGKKVDVNWDWALKHLRTS